MYIHKLFEETRIDVKHDLMRQYSLGALIASTASGLEADNIPFEIDTSTGELGTLRCHFGRSHPIWKSLCTDTEVMAIFQGPNAYISPRWYVAGQQSGKILPSWNYAVVHAYGQPRIVDDTDWLLKHLSALTDQNEARQRRPWKLTEASAEFVQRSAEHLVGMEIPVRRLLGKWFVSQQRTVADRENLAKSLRDSPYDVSAATAALIELVDRRNE